MPSIDVADAAEGYAAGAKAEVVIARTRAAVAHRQVELEQRGLITCPQGNVSARVRVAELFVTVPEARFSEKVSPESTIVCRLDGTPVPDLPGSDLTVSAQVSLHAAIYRAHPDIRVVIVLDTPELVAWAASGQVLPCLTAQAAEHFGSQVSASAPVSDDDPQTARDQRVDAVVAALADSPRGLLVPGLGAVVVGRDSREALRGAQLLAASARQAVIAAHLGVPLTSALATTRS